MSMFHHSLYSQYNSRKPYLNKNQPVSQNGILSKIVFGVASIKCFKLLNSEFSPLQRLVWTPSLFLDALYYVKGGSTFRKVCLSVCPETTFTAGIRNCY